MFFHSTIIFSLSTTLFFILTVLTIPQTTKSSSSSSEKKSPSRPKINITKHLSFPNFGRTSPEAQTIQDLTLLGSAAVSPQTGCIQIPENNLQNTAGRAIYSSPIRLLDPKTRSPASFTTTFSFRIHNPSARPGPISGGLSFVIVPDELTVGRPGPWLGMLNDACEDEYKVVAVEFDTRMNPEFGDPNDNHVGLDLGSIVSTISINASDFGIRLNDGSVHRAWINYDGNSKFFEIYLGPDELTLPSRAAYSGNLDLSPYLNEYMFVGFSGSTGGNHTEVHSICSWNFTSASRAVLRVPSDKSCAGKITGSLVNGSTVAVKRFHRPFSGVRDSDMRRRMIKEVKALGKIRHPNLVSIRGWCFDRGETIVVYDFVPNGSLDKWLFGFGVLPWTRRFKVVKDVAESLSYIHSKDLAHKNVKTSSVFLDISFRALLGDFGFVLSTVESTRFESLVSQKVDIFEFGVLVLEVVSGRGRMGSAPGERDLLDLAWAMHESDKKGTLVDRRMGPVVNPDQAIRAVEVGLMCTLNDNKGRPTMEEVVDYLNFERPVTELPTVRPVSLFPYSSTTGLCSGYSCAPFK
ncbi:Unknown protein [Striga hermonthica]|uniref:non-specific serine/threonine protein kinase n=1 Tax=Striga hermonthica TaxID=68872 RepID=A0A9N7MSH3_STRHE|nr:Unknown protein [Striga hermonthica]